MNDSARPSMPSCRSESAWFDALPPGTFVTVNALRKFAWPIDCGETDRWLVVKCDPGLSYGQYLGWLGGLPKTGVIVDPRDERHRRFMLSALETAAA